MGKAILEINKDTLLQIIEEAKYHCEKDMALTAHWLKSGYWECNRNRYCWG